ncbi:hypothetical protein TNCV_1577011 [Trichonephila clavipes]|nr:hypothetical protein TNCV_1577011 [Trichonephila clavipes]
MGKLPDLDAFDRRHIVGARCMGHSISEMVRQLEFSRSTVSRVYQKTWMVDKKLEIRQNAKDNQPLQCLVRDGSGVLYVSRKAKHLLKLPPS